MACKNSNISSNFWLFNDDFFVMEQVEKPTNYYNGDLYKRIVQLEDSYHGITPYTEQLRNMCKELESMGLPTLNYTLHVPILINKKNMIELLNMTDCPMFRSLYGNFVRLKAKKSTDVKIVSKEKKYKGGIYLSTDDNSFNGIVGQQIKDTFPDRCKYERS